MTISGLYFKVFHLGAPSLYEGYLASQGYCPKHSAGFAALSSACECAGCPPWAVATPPI